MNTLVLNQLDQLSQIAAKFIELAGEKKQFAFYGSMGAGKTTFIKAICNHLKVIDQVSSPSFAIVNEYKTNNGENIYHFDFYRIKSITEVYNLGYEDYFYGNDYCFIEWPELVEELIPDSFIKVNIEAGNNGSRTISF